MPPYVFKGDIILVREMRGKPDEGLHLPWCGPGVLEISDKAYPDSHVVHVSLRVRPVPLPPPPQPGLYLSVESVVGPVSHHEMIAHRTESPCRPVVAVEKPRAACVRRAVVDYYVFPPAGSALVEDLMDLPGKRLNHGKTPPSGNDDFISGPYEIPFREVSVDAADFMKACPVGPAYAPESVPASHGVSDASARAQEYSLAGPYRVAPGQGFVGAPDFRKAHSVGLAYAPECVPALDHVVNAFPRGRESKKNKSREKYYSVKDFAGFSHSMFLMVFNVTILTPLVRICNRAFYFLEKAFAYIK